MINGGIEDLAVSLGVDMGEARLVRLSVMGMFEEGFSKDECVRGLVSRGYDGIVIGFEYLRCSEISGEIHSRVQRKLVKKDVAMQMFRDRVMCVGIDGGEMSKDEIVGVLSGVIMNGVYRDWETDRKSTRLNSSHRSLSRMPSSA